MGLTTGHVFSDGDTVTAAKLNAMVNDATITNDTITPAMIKDDAIESRHISDGAITSNHITAGSVDMAALASGQTTEGYLIQTDASGDLTTLAVGALGTVLVSGGAETAPSFTTVGAAGINAAMISDHAEITAPGEDDLLLVKDKVSGVNKSLQIQNLYKTVSDLTLLGSSDVADADEYLVIDGANPKKITQANLQTATLTSVNDLTALDSTTVADDDVLLVYDTSTGTVKKIAKSELVSGSGTSSYLARGTVTRSGGVTTIGDSSINIASYSSSRNAGGGGTGYMFINFTFTNSVPTSKTMTFTSTGTTFSEYSRTTTAISFRSNSQVAEITASVSLSIAS